MHARNKAQPRTSNKFTDMQRRRPKEPMGTCFEDSSAKRASARAAGKAKRQARSGRPPRTSPKEHNMLLWLTPLGARASERRA